MVINEEIVYETNNYNGEHRNANKNITFMGRVEDFTAYKYSLFGQMTDINIWSRTFNAHEVLQWMECKMDEGGNVLDWKTAKWRSVELEEVSVDEEEVCIGGTKSFLSDQIKRETLITQTASVLMFLVEK